MGLFQNVFGATDGSEPTPPPMNESLGMPGPGSLPTTIPAPAPVMPAAPGTPSAPTVGPTPGAASNIGRAFRSMVGTQVDYRVQPDGSVQSVPVKLKGSQIFRGILASALLGADAAEAAHRENPQGGFLSGVATGGGASVKANTAVDAQRYQRAQEDFKNQQEVQKSQNEKKRLDQEVIYQQAQIAHMHAEDLHANAMMDLMASEHLQKLNDSNAILSEKYEAKGIVPNIDVAGKNINGQIDNGTAIMDAVNKDPHALDAPAGYYRVHTQHVDTSGLSYKAGAGWVDQDGKNVDMANRTTHTFYDIPQSTFNEAVTMSNKEWNKAIGSTVFPNDDKPRTGTYGDLVALKDKASKTAREGAMADLDKQKVLFEIAKTKREIALIGSEASKSDARDQREAIANLTEQARVQVDLVKASEFDEPTKKQAMQDLQDINKQLQALRNKAGVAPATGTTPPGSAPVPNGFTPQSWKAIPPNVQTGWDTLPNKDKVFWGLSKSGLPVADQIAHVQAAGGLSAADKDDVTKRLYQAAGQSPHTQTQTLFGNQ